MCIVLVNFQPTFHTRYFIQLGEENLEDFCKWTKVYWEPQGRNQDF